MKKIETITFKTNTEIKKLLIKIATEEDRTISYIVNRIVTEYLNSYKK